MSHAVRTLHTDVTLRPFLVIWEVTRACQLACRHCRADAQHHRNPGELTTEQGKALLDDLASYGPPHPMVVLTGGDPFERPDLAELVAYGSAAGLHMSLSPSVTPRLTLDALVALRAAGAHAVSLSLDGAAAAVHDAIRGIPGVFDATLAAARSVRSAGLRLQVNTTVTRATVLDLPGVLARVVDLDVALWSVFFLVPTGRGGALQPLGADEVEEVLHWLHDVSDLVAVKTTEAPHFRRVALQRAELHDAAPTVGPLRAELLRRTVELLGDRPPRSHRPRPPLAVNAGSGFAFVDHLGQVYPSGFLPLVAGTVHAQPFSTIYRDSPLLQALRDRDRLGGRCGRCEFRWVCGGSRSHAYAVTGDPLAADPTCAYAPA
jgi:radical SAM protein